MPALFGKERTRAELLRRVGNIAQVAGIREYVHRSGWADGVRAVEVNTGDLRFEVLPGRCLDIATASFRGIPLGYYSKSGIRHPAFFAKNDPSGFLDNFLGGLLTTCGLHNIGPARRCAGRPHEMHGELANMPAEKIGVREEWRGDDLFFTVEGEVHHSSFYHGDLILRRRITSRLGGRSLRVEDEVENLDFAPAPCLVLYHAQFGFPLLGEASCLLTSPVEEFLPRADILGSDATGKADAAASARRDAAEKASRRFGPPVDGAEEACFYRRLRPDADGWAAACLFNPELGENGLGVYVRYQVAALPLLVQWKMLRSREYVCGLEPATASLDERDEAVLAASLLQPLEKRRFGVEIGVVDGMGEWERLLAQGEEHA